MNIRAFSATADTFDAKELASASFVAIHSNCEIDPASLNLQALSGAVHGATSCLGAMTSDGITENLGVFAIDDPNGAYGTAKKPITDDAKGAARAATLDALTNADRLGETPELIWLSCTPGAEEQVLEGIETVVGPDVPIIGGSAADNDVSGGWFVYDRKGKCHSGVIVTVMFPSCPVSFAYHNGYAPTEKAGTVTRVDGRRVLEIDNRPAFDVYREWTDAAVDINADDASMQSILSESTLFPFGRKVSDIGGVSSYLLAHPAAACTDGSLDLFATVHQGEVLTQMTGTETGLIERAGRVASLARSAGHNQKTAVAGALMVYCGGCMLSVRHRLDEVVTGVSAALENAPFLGTFTFGEQGRIMGAGNRHGNLMISCIIFG